MTDSDETPVMKKAVELYSYEKGGISIVASRRIVQNEGGESTDSYGFNFAQIASNTGLNLPAEQLAKPELVTDSVEECDKAAEDILDALLALKVEYDKMNNKAAAMFVKAMPGQKE